ncbi:MAG: bifunctional UDP-sugar hydrolase/5'-nucleotidase [bacterium]|nr:bifunctional UDP-sugar hydrolase/5'-nucleotidase [bacterium]
MTDSAGSPRGFLLVAVTDVHGRYISLSTLDMKPHERGLDRVHSYLKKKRAEGWDTLVIDNGDSIQGTPLVDLFPYGTGGDHPLNLTHRTLGFDAFILGNHEFNFGFDSLQEIASKAPVPWLSANMTYAEDGSTAYKPYQIFEKGGLKVGLIGLITAYVPRWEHNSMIPGLAFAEAAETAAKYAQELRPQVDVLIASYHGGYHKDPETGELWCHDPLENEGEAILQAAPELDLLITGHQHRSTVFQQENGTWSAQPGCYANQFLSVAITPQPSGNRSVTLRPELIETRGFEPQPELTKALDPQIARVRRKLDGYLGSADPSFSITDPMREVWLKKHPMIQWVNNLIAEHTGAPIVCTSLLDSALPGLPEEVHLRDIIQNYFFQDNLCLIHVTGEVLMEALEQVASFFILQTGKSGEPKVTINAEWRAFRVRSYNYDIFDGIDYGFDLKRPIGERLAYLRFKGDDVKPRDRLLVGLTTYRAQGAFYKMFNPEQIVEEFPEKITDLMVADLKQRGHLSVEPVQNFNVSY